MGGVIVEIECLCTGILFADVVCSPIPGVPEAGTLVPADTMQLSLGGCCSNAALDLARLGVRVGAAGCVGDDVFGQFIIDTLSRGGVGVGGVHKVEGINTASTMVINVRGEDRRFISSPGANHRFTVDHVPPAWVEQARVLYVGGYLMLPGLENERALEWFRSARASGTKTVLDVVYLGGEDCRRAVELLLPETDYFLPNEDEAAVLTGLSDPVEQAQAFRDAGAANVVITRGEEGCLMVGDGVRLRAGAYPIELVGGTGAGDAFDAGLMMGLLAGEDAAGCLRWASALGASCCRHLSATGGVFNRDEAEEFMRKHQLEIEAF